MNEYKLCYFESQREVKSTILGIKFGVLERLGEEPMNQGTESHAVVPRCREVGDINVLRGGGGVLGVSMQTTMGGVKVTQKLYYIIYIYTLSYTK